MQEISFLKKNIKKEDAYINVFFFTMLFLFFMWFALWCRSPNGRESNIFFGKLCDMFADFFNVLRYISEKNPYFNTVNGFSEKEYLPLAYFILYPFSLLNNYANMSLEDCWHSNISVFSCFLYITICLFFLFNSLQCLCKKYGLSSKIIYALFFSSVVVRSIDRANIFFLAASSLNYFLVFYDSEVKKERIFACFALAFAATLKIYPVIFILLYVASKNYKEVSLTIIIGLLLAFLPFLFFRHGFGNILRLYENVKLANEYDFFGDFAGALARPVMFLTQNILHMEGGMIFVKITRYLILSLSVLSLSLLFIKSETLKTWDKFVILTFSVLYFPNTNKLYTGMYIFPLVILFFATLNERIKIKNWLILVLFVIALCPFQVYEDFCWQLLHIVPLVIGLIVICMRIKYLVVLQHRKIEDGEVKKMNCD